MQIDSVSIDELTEDPKNARTHDRRNIDAIKASIERFGQVEPLVVREGTSVVIGGNGRLRALRELGQERVDVVFFDGTDAQAKALGVALNRTAELADWDEKALLGVFSDLAEADFTELDLMELGWKKSELEKIVSSYSVPTIDDEKDPPLEKEKTALVRITGKEHELFRAVVAVAHREVDQSMSDGAVLAMLCNTFLESHGVK